MAMSAPLLTTPKNGTSAESAGSPSLLAVGLDHHCAPIELRERVSLSRAESEALLLRLVAHPEIAEAFVVSTCNRTEVYLRPRHLESAFRTALELAFNARAPEVEREGRYWVLHDAEAARHLLAVASGLESMVLGEPEILGQVKRAAESAEAIGTAGTVLKRLLRTALSAGRRARAETEIGEGAVSLGYSVVELARHIFLGVEDKSCLVLGGGEMAMVVARSLVEKGVRDLRFAVRGNHRHAALLEEFPSAQMTAFQDRYQTIAECDLVVASTSADEPVIEAGDLRQAIRPRKARPLLIVDLGVPRNVAAPVGKLNNVFLHDIDSLQHLIARNLEKRREQVPAVETIVQGELEHLLGWYQGLGAEPLVAELQRRAERIRREEVDSVRARFPAELHDDLDRMTRALVRKILHHPSASLRKGGGEQALAHRELARELFQLGEGEQE